MSSRIKKLTNGYGYKYAELSTIHEELEKQGITYYQFIEYNKDADADYIYTVIIKDGKESAPCRGCRVVMGGESMKSLAQAQGSAITYARRYSLLMALGWATEDDDGASAGSKPSGRIDFAVVRKKLGSIESETDLTKYWQELHLSEKQAEMLKPDFAKRKAQLGGQSGVGR